MGGFDPCQLRREFPIFERNPGLVFLDSAASAQKPRQVIDGIAEFYRNDYANVHRGVYQLSERSTEIDGAGRLPDATLLVRERNDLAQTPTPVALLARAGSGARY